MEQRHILGLSGGKDSAALAIYMRDRYPEIGIQYFFTDTGKELPEVSEFLAKLEGYLGRRIHQLNPHRTFDFWLREYHNFLPSAQTRWCTRQLKLLPMRQWIKPWLDAGDEVISYVAIRSDEDHREGYSPSKNRKMTVRMPFREDFIDKQGVYDILESSGIGLPAYYKWRSRSGCTFCFFQQKIEWVRLKRVHPEAYEEAKLYEKTAIMNGSPFTWSQGESLEDIEQPVRIAEIENDFQLRKERDLAARKANPLRVIEPNNSPEEIDEIYMCDEGNGACLTCHK